MRKYEVVLHEVGEDHDFPVITEAESGPEALETVHKAYPRHIFKLVTIGPLAPAKHAKHRTWLDGFGTFSTGFDHGRAK